jgi:hypothetical protein
MANILKAMSISGGILLVVVILTIVISIVAVNRGTAAMKENSKSGGRH